MSHGQGDNRTKLIYLESSEPIWQWWGNQWKRTGECEFQIDWEPVFEDCLSIIYGMSQSSYQRLIMLIAMSGV